MKHTMALRQLWGIFPLASLPHDVAQWLETLAEQPPLKPTGAFIDSQAREQLMTYRCDHDKIVDLASIKLVDDADGKKIGDIVDKDAKGYTVLGRLATVEHPPTSSVPRFNQDITVLLAPVSGDRASEIMRVFYKIAKPYYRITDALSNHPPLSTFMSVNAVLDVKTQTVVDFQEADVSYASFKGNAVISEDPVANRITFKAYIANGGFTVMGDIR